MFPVQIFGCFGNHPKKFEFAEVFIFSFANTKVGCKPFYTPQIENEFCHFIHLKRLLKQKMTFWSRYKAWRHKHGEGVELIISIVEFFVALKVVFEIMHLIGEFLSHINLSFLSYPINLKFPAGLIFLFFILLFLLYFILRYRISRQYQKLTKAVSEFKNESSTIQKDIVVNVTSEISLSDSIKLKYPLKLYFHITNPNEKTIVIDKVIFEATTNIKIHSDSKIKVDEFLYKPTLYLGTVNGQERWDSKAVIEPYKEVKFFIPIDREFGKKALENTVSNKNTGTVLLRAIMLDNEILSNNLRFEF